MKQTVNTIELTLNSELVVFGWYGEGHYTKSKAYEIAFLPKEQYELFNMDKAFEGVDNYFYDLDGKHSEVEGEVFKETITVEELLENKNLYKEILKGDFGPTSDEWFKEQFNKDTGKYQFNLFTLIKNYIKQLERFESSYTQLTFTVPVKFEDEISKLVAEFLEKNK